MKAKQLEVATKGFTASSFIPAINFVTTLVINLVFMNVFKRAKPAILPNDTYIKQFLLNL